MFPITSLTFTVDGKDMIVGGEPHDVITFLSVWHNASPAVQAYFIEEVRKMNGD